MWPSLPELARLIGCLTLTGIAVKFMDDYLDADADKVIAKFNWTYIVNKGIFPYAMLCLVVACFLLPKTALSLFLAAYALGMGAILDDKMPSGLKGYHESLVVLLGGFILLGPKEMSLALSNIAMLQIFDDWRDSEEDPVVTKYNTWRLLGPPLAILLFISALVLGSFTNPFQTYMVLILAALFYLVENKLETS